MSDVKLAPEQDFSQCRLVTLADGTLSGIKDHVKIGVRALMENPYFALFDEMGGMKTAQTIIAAQFLFQQKRIEKVVVIAPHSVVDVWYDPELGELARHLFHDMPAIIEYYHGRTRNWKWGVPIVERMKWIITNYEYIRAKARLEEFEDQVHGKTLLVLDESSAVKSYNTAQTKACMALRRRAGRVVLLNGTPIANSPMDMFSQGNLMHPNILECKGITYFRARYCVMGGYVAQTAWGAHPTQVVGWKNLEDLQNRFKPYVLRRLKKDCLDLPPVLPPITLTATLSEETWKIYKQMRDDMVAWLKNQTVSVAQQTITKVLRLSQITSGFLGGIEAEVPMEAETEERPDWLEKLDLTTYVPPPSTVEPLQEIGAEKLGLFLERVSGWFEEDPNLKLLVWCRFIPELDRLLKQCSVTFPKVALGCIAGVPLLGEQHKVERQKALRLLDPRTAPEGPVIVGGTYGTGSLGLNLTACHTQIDMSYDYSLWKYEQKNARINRPGQVHAVSMFDIVAVGPRGQHTIDHVIIKARRDKEEVANWTTAAWIQALAEE